MHFIGKHRNKEFLYFRKNPGEPFTPRRLLGGSQQAPRRHLGGTKAPRRLQEALDAESELPLS